MLSLAQAIKQKNTLTFIWSAVGIAIIATIGITFFGEQLTFSRVFFLTLIVIGVVGLNLTKQST